jgi:hypothetical protein
MAVVLLLLACAGLVAPGLLVARRLAPGAAWPVGFVVSSTLLLHVVLALDAVGAPVRAWVALALLGLVAAAAWRTPAAGGVAAPAPPLASRERATWAVVAGLLALFALRAFLQPLFGFDTPFRWEHLARVLLAREALDVYPPVEAADFEVYPYLDGIPPLVSCVYWLLYAALGEPAPRATALVVAAQWAGIVALAARLAARLGTPRAGCAAALLAATCPFLAQVVGCGQETGVIALSLLAALVVVVEAEAPRADRALVLAGLCVGTCGLTREYGLAFAPAVALVAHRRGFGARGALVLLGVAAAACAPWYARSLVLTGNPLWGSPGPLSTSPAFDAYLQGVREVHGWSVHTGAKVFQLASDLLVTATLPLLAGGAALALDRRARGLWPPVAVGAVLFVASVPYTMGGVSYALRVLLPVVAVAAAAGGLALDALAARGRGPRGVVLAALGVSGAWCALCMLALPSSRPWGLPGGLVANARRATPALVRGYAAVALPHLPAEGTVLTTNAYLALELRGAGRRAVPAWSPEVAFLFDPAVGHAEALVRLRQAGIVAWADLRDPVVERGLRAPFFVEARRLPVAAPGLLEIRVLPPM